MLTLDLDIKSKGKPIPQGVYYPGLMENRIRKSNNPLQPLYEAITNAWEAIVDNNYEFEVHLCHKRGMNLFGEELAFASLQVKDYGEGFTDESFLRFSQLFNNTKNKNNLGTGRIQFLHSFKFTQIESVFIGNDGKKYKRRILLSLSFIEKDNEVMFAEDPIKIDDNSPVYTIVAFFSPLNEDDRKELNDLSCDKLKENIIKRYLTNLCIEREYINKISILHFVNELKDEDQSCTIEKSDIPMPCLEDEYQIPFSRLEPTGRDVIRTNNTMKFEVTGFSFPSSVLTKNEVRLTSKGETIMSGICDFSLISNAPRQDSTSFLFLVSSNYLTLNDPDVRGELKLYTRKDFIEKRNLFTGKELILLDDIEEYTQETIVRHYPAFKALKEKADEDLAELARLFSLNTHSFSKAGVKSTDSVATVLRKVYNHSAELKAELDTKIKNLFDSIKLLNPSDKKFRSSFSKKVSELNDVLPQSIKEELANYISRRTLALELMHKALDEELEIQKVQKESSKKKKSKKNPEAILHNILFPKHSTSTIESNLWMLSDEYIHFIGHSEYELDDVIINGEKLFKESLTPEEEKYKIRTSKGIDVGRRRPDILLFPEEGRCIIIELKAPDVDVSKHLHQINQYASIIHNLCNENFHFNSFYGYLIGESDDIYSIMDSDGDFSFSSSLGYLVRPHKGIPDIFGRGQASLYTEIIKFSDLLKRAELRSKVFIEPINRLRNDNSD